MGYGILRTGADRSQKSQEAGKRVRLNDGGVDHGHYIFPYTIPIPTA